MRVHRDAACHTFIAAVDTDFAFGAEVPMIPAPRLDDEDFQYCLDQFPN